MLLQHPWVLGSGPSDPKLEKVVSSLVTYGGTVIGFSLFCINEAQYSWAEV